MPRQKPVSLRTLAQRDDPFTNSRAVIASLRAAASESSYLEWKLELPFGPASTTRNKYRTVKAAISFANSDGGFILFGVDPSGHWRGLERAALDEMDPAKVIELVNGCIAPDLTHLGYHAFRSKGKWFAVLHVPASSSVPHVTTKDLQEKVDGKLKVAVQRRAVYVRRGGQSDLATPSQLHRIIDRRIRAIRDEMLRRVKEVPLLVPSGAGGGTGSRTVLVVKKSADPDAPAVRVTRDATTSQGVLLHEELSDGLFDEINNVVDANFLLAKGESRFVFGREVYYRIYAERHHVRADSSHLRALAHIGLEDAYGPYFYWVLRCSDADVVDLFVHSTTHCRYPNIYGTYRLACVLGEAAVQWISERLDRRWRKHPQPPEYYWTFRQLWS